MAHFWNFPFTALLQANNIFYILCTSLNTATMQKQQAESAQCILVAGDMDPLQCTGYIYMNIVYRAKKICSCVPQSLTLKEV